MIKQVKSLVAGAALVVVAASAAADVKVTSSNKPSSPRNASIAACVDAIQSYHSKSTRLFLNNKASYQEVDGRRSLSVQGWVWRNGDRVKVSHECTNTAVGDLALSVVFADETQLASN